VYNSVFAGHLVGLLLDGTSTQNNATSGLLQIRNTILAGEPTAAAFFAVPSGSTMTHDSLANWFLNASFHNDTIVKNTAVMFTDAFNLEAPNAVPMTGSPLLGNADFTNSNLQNSFFTPETYMGAFGTTDWTSGWAVWDPQNLPYEAK
jgi:hypothetical protein